MLGSHVRCAGGAALIAIVAVLAGAPSALAAPSIVNTDTSGSGNASFQETGAIEQDSGGNRRVDATFVVNVDPGRNITQVVGDGLNASFSQDAGSSTNTRVVHATFNLTNFPGVSCGVFSGTRRNTRSIAWRVVDSAGQSSQTVAHNLKIIEDEQCTGATDYPVLESSDHTSNQDIAPGGSFPFGFTCDDADGSGDGDRCDFITARWRRLNDGETETEGTFDAEDNATRDYTASAPTSRGVWVLEAQLHTENGVEDGDWWRLGRVRVNPSGFNPGSITFPGAAASSPPSVNQGASATAALSGFSSDAQVVSWSGTTANGIAFAGNPLLSGGNLVNPALTTAETQRSVSTSTFGTKSVSATVIDSGAIDAADTTRDSATRTGQLYVNAPPTAAGQSVDATEDTPKAITLAGADPDDQPAPLTYTIVSGPSKGSLSGSGASRTYTPNPNATGTDSFTFKVADGPAGSAAYAESAPATVTIDIAAVNDAPTASDQSVATAEDTAKSFTLIAVDVDSSTLTYAISQQPAHGTVSCSGTSCTYTPQANYAGPDSLRFTVSDGQATDEGRIDITVTPVNDGPQAGDTSVTLDEDSQVTFTLPASDVEDAQLALSTEVAPQHGTVTYAGGLATYTPAPNFHGSDELTYRATDDDGASDTGRVEIEVQSVNDRPVADGQMVSTDEDTPLGITLSGSDVEGDDLTFAVVGQPERGTLSCQADGACTYEPDANFAGTDTFTYTASDGDLTSQPATVSIVVRAVNDTPVAGDTGVTLDEDSEVTFTPPASDVEDGELALTSAVAPQHGTVTYGNGQATYTPDPDFNGTDEFAYQATDDDGASDTGTVSVEVLAVNDRPVALAQMVSTGEDTPLRIDLDGADVDGDALTFAVDGQPADGTLSCQADGTCTYTPDENFHGSDAFTFTASDGRLESAPATVDVVVNPVNDAPVAQDAAATTDEDTAVDVAITASDVDGDTLTYTPSDPAHGSASCTGSTCRYEPDADHNGTDSFAVTVSDGELSDVVQVAVTIRPVNDAPVATDQTVFVDEDGLLLVRFDAVDVDGDDLTFERTGGPAHGQVQCDGPTCAYSPARDYFGDDALTFRVSDGELADAGTVDIVVRPVNDAPDIRDESVSTDEDEAVDVALDATDVDDADLELSVSRQPAKGTVSLQGRTARYVPAANANGTDTFDVQASDGELTDEATVTVTIRPVNDAPVAQHRAVETDEDVAVDFTVQATDVDGDELSVAVGTAPRKGALSCDADGCTYTPDPDANGGDEAQVVVSDGHGGSDTATVSFTIRPVNDAPVARDQSATTDEDTPKTVALDVADVDGDALAVRATDGPAHGTVTFDGTSATYAPAADFHGDDAFTYEVRDGAGATATATVALTVRPVNDRPTVDDVTTTTPEDTAITIPVPATDVDGDALTYSATAPQHGTVACSAGSCRYTPAQDRHGDDAFTVVVTDPSGLSDTATVSVTVTPVNDAPVAQDLALGTDEDTELAFTLQASDVDGDALSYAAGTPQHGTVACLAQSCRYRPAADFAGTDRFTYTVSDGQGATDTATVTIDVGEISYATRVVAEPMVFVTRRDNGMLLGALGLQVRLLKVRAQLTRADTGAPQAGETLAFRAGSTPLCDAVTGSDGWATCTVALTGLPSTVLGGGYTAFFAGDPDLHPSQGSAPLASV